MAIELSPGRTVGRDAELQELDGALDALAGGAAACIALEGEPGIGKTRLLDELRGRAEDRGHLVLAGTAAEFERDVPFSVWADALDAYVASQDIEADGDLSDILPSRGRPEAAGSVPDERYRAHRAARRLLERLAADRPLVVTLDDLHWCDGASIELIASILRRALAAPVLLALSFRSGQAPSRLVAALGVPSVRRLALEQLAEADAAALLGEVDARAAAALFEQAGGNPFYLEQLARVAGTGAPADAGGDGVPRAVVASLGEELSTLSEAERALVQGAAVTGDPFDADVAAAVAELAEPGWLTALDGLLARELVRPTRLPRRFAFRHPLVRRAVYESTPGGWRLAAHERAADALAAHGAPAAERAHHVEQAARPGDEEAFAVLMEAGAATAAHAPGASARWLEAALRLLPHDDRARRADVTVALASALRSMGELERCRTTLLEAIDLLPAGDAVRRVELTTLCAAVEHWLGRHEDAHRRLARAWDELPDGATAAAAALGTELAVDALYDLELKAAIEAGAGALENAKAVGEPGLIATAAAALCLAEACAGRLDDARGHHEEAVALDGLTDAELAPRLEALYYLAWAETYLERYADAIAHSERGIAIARATGEGRLLVPLTLVRCFPYEMQGRLAEAIELCEAAVEGARLSPNPHYLFWSLFELAWARYFAGELDAAVAAAEESARIGDRLFGGTMPSAGGGAGWVLAVSRFELGDAAGARELMRQAGGDELAGWTAADQCFNLENLALAELALGDPDAAEAFAARAEANAARLGTGLSSALSGRARAAVLLAAGEALEAARAAEASAHAARGIGARLQAAYSTGLAGRALAAAGERERAIAALREAETELDACGSVRVRGELRRELRRLGARAETRGPATDADAGVDALTPREREIADLVVERHTNREIAAALFLSDKTIESHLRNIFVKLGASSRVEVARAIERARADA